MSASPSTTAWVRVHTTYDRFEAKLLAARLGAEGVLVEVRGSTDGAYPVGSVHLYVPPDEADDARAVLSLAAEPMAADGDDDGDPDASRSVPRRRLLLLAVAAVALVVVTVGRVLLLVG